MRVPTAKSHPNPEGLSPCCPGKSLDWLMASIYCHFCLKALGTQRQQKKKKNTMDPSQHHGGLASVKLPGVHSRFFFPWSLCSSVSVSRICGVGDGHEGCRVKAALESVQLPFCGGPFGSPLGCRLSEHLLVIGWGLGDQRG